MKPETFTAYCLLQSEFPDKLVVYYKGGFYLV